MSAKDFFHIEPNPHVLAESSFDDGYNKCKQDILNIIGGYIHGPFQGADDLLYKIKDDINKL